MSRSTDHNGLTSDFVIKHRLYAETCEIPSTASDDGRLSNCCELLDVFLPKATLIFLTMHKKNKQTHLINIFWGHQSAIISRLIISKLITIIDFPTIRTIQN